ncbi:endonuclease IV [Desulfosporosinus orientis DSM 765]|uniref:Endonuclease IV n=1 Tax=Desulfosporosinus orientis (strain ATCC 19365 / DSM 765 / NCIMB 8382 / VKM B-1628 / Singapore I) TaxID=768706 RepID=G7WE89_DESOD|nr:TIM barrel protein [Desulfosporosinus orientis]AET70065.1 endonuclease IV [Desulfosporosinus orientis DSM 765]
MPLLFGTAGVPLSAKDRSSEGGVRRVRELNLEAMELEFVQGVRMGEEKAKKVGAVAKVENIALSCHAPYYINLNSREPDKISASRDRIIQTSRIGQIIGVRSVVFHPAFKHDDSDEVVLKRVIKELSLVRETLDAEGNDVILRPETTGKGTQLGDLAETIQIAKEIPGVLPCIDFGHLHARTNGRYNTYDEFCEILDITAEELGERWVSNVHFHISGIEYGIKGEKRHLALKESDFRYEDLLRACRSYGVEGLAISESPVLEEDALFLQQTYRALG